MIFEIAVTFETQLQNLNILKSRDVVVLAVPGVCRAPPLPQRPVSAALRPRTLLYTPLLHTPDLLPCALHLWFKI